MSRFLSIWQSRSTGRFALPAPGGTIADRSTGRAVPLLLVLASIPCLLLGLPAPAAAVNSDREAIAVLADSASGAVERREAWDRLSSRPPAAMLTILDAIPEDDVITANWLRLAFEQIASRHCKDLPLTALRAIAADPQRPGPVRRLALDAVEQAEPGFVAEFLSTQTGDAEFGAEAIALRLHSADEAAAQGETGEAIALLEEALTEARRFAQVQELTQRLADLGRDVDPLQHLGVVTSWALIGSFETDPSAGIREVYPPEEAVDLDAVYAGEETPLRWQRAEVVGRDGRIDLREHGIESERGGVAYAVSFLETQSPIRATLLASAVDNVVVWVNGERVLSSPMSLERRNFRVDAHAGEALLNAGVNEILVKLIKTPDPGERRAAAERMGIPVRANHPADRWEFMLRLIDEADRGLPLRPAFPTP